MEQTLEDLKNGLLKGVKKLKLACNLKEFPQEIISLSDTLEVLDLSDNQLSVLPDNIRELKKLKIIFFARNKFTEFPSILSEFPVLNMIGFKSNYIHTVPENSFPEKLNWLILTDNKIEKLPNSIGKCSLLQKFMMAGNLLSELPETMRNCKNLELFRVSDNNLSSIPDWLFTLPKLSWFAFEGNNLNNNIKVTNELKSFNWDQFTVNKTLGEGASGVISKAYWNLRKENVALKIFKGEVTSDGLPEDEMKIAIKAGNHKNLIPVLGKIKNHPENRNGLILKLINSSFVNLGNPPSLESCTRDTFNKDSLFTLEQVLKIIKSIASVCAHLHNIGINHGDLYAHNILIDENIDCFLGDFGAASFYNRDLNKKLEFFEVKAFACLVEDLLSLIKNIKTNTDEIKKYKELIKQCSCVKIEQRLTFLEIQNKLFSF